LRIYETYQRENKIYTECYPKKPSAKTQRTDRKGLMKFMRGNRKPNTTETFLFALVVAIVIIAITVLGVFLWITFFQFLGTIIQNILM